MYKNLTKLTFPLFYLILFSFQLILPASSWAQWAGLLSNATEIHVNYLPYHPIMPNMPQYIYHDEKKKSFFGRYHEIKKDVVFELEWDKAKKKYISKSPIQSAKFSIIPAADFGSLNSTKVEKELLDHSRTGSENSTTKLISTMPTLSPTSKGTSNISKTESSIITNSSATHNQTTYDKLRSSKMKVSTWWWQELKTV